MSAEPSVLRAIGFWRTVGLLLRVALRRSSGRFQRQQQLLNQRTGSSISALSILALLAVWGLMAGLNAGAAYVLYETVSIAQKQVQDQEKIAVNSVRSNDFIAVDTGRERFAALNQFGPVPPMLATLVLAWWLITLVFQGEGLELDLQRRRHPMWEWLFSHPVRPGAVFLAEMLSPIAANPIYVTAPLFFAVLYGTAYDAATGVAAMILIGVPVAIAAACVGKAIEIGVILRFPPRSRGALIGFMSWLGYVAMFSFLLVAATIENIVPTVAHVLRPVAQLLWWPLASWAIGLRPDGSLSFLWGVAAWWITAAVMITGGVWFTVWGAQRGLAGHSEAKSIPTAKGIFTLPFLRKDPLYRKEILWFLRDRGAIVQAILIPLTIAGFQLFNLRMLARNSWQFLSGLAIVFGTYFLWILGPRSLASEGPALWIAQTWPRGLEELMKAKARLWFIIATSLVSLVFIFALVRFPGDWWKVVLIWIGWNLFGRSMALKSVTLVTTPSSSGEPEKVPSGRRWAASLGMLTFAIGILGQKWSLAIVGIVYSWLTAAAMWQNFRARLPYLFDQWSEELPPPPTLMHAMVAISALIEGGAVVTAFFMLLFGEIGGTEMVPIVQAIGFGAVAIIVWLATSEFLRNRDVKYRDVWCWHRPEAFTKWWWWSGAGKYDLRFVVALVIGAAAGLVLGLLATGYVWVLSNFGPFTETYRAAGEQAENVPNLWAGLFIMAVFFAPFAEEYLFRGLLFRALDREWGGWRALLGSAAFFAIYHPPHSWLPVAIVGVAAALVFKKTGRLTPAVVLHMVYNAVVIGLAMP
ncbi:MAG TPA: CPBP family intramembrane glutamic endopeptidase [Pyrinomonadaceae bacterium]|nr:CPBP family intramembrane glutamic endopeptidase [Pyrinomonadaceae bacterium]